MERIYGAVLWLRVALHREKGQAMVEYAIILVLVSIVVIVILITMGNQVKNVFSNVACALGANCHVDHGD